MDVTVTELVELPDGRIEERRPPTHLASDKATVLDIHGSTFCAGARTVAGLLPIPEDAVRPVVVLRLRGRTKVGATFISVLDRYAGRLAAVGGRLYLSGVDKGVRTTIIRSRKLDVGGNVVVEAMTPSSASRPGGPSPMRTHGWSKPGHSAKRTWCRRH